MKLLMTQRIGSMGENVGGLYLNIDHISAVYYVRELSPAACHVLMMNGTIYRVAHSVSEIVDGINELTEETDA